jgi:hemerythrin superfamily protein
MPRQTQQATASGKRAKQPQSTDAVQMLEQDHRAVERLFDEFSSGDQARKGEIAQQIFQELDVHATIEEEVFYPALRSQADLGELGQLEQGDSEIGGANTLDQDNFDEDEEEADDEETNEEVGEDVIASAYEDHQAVKELIGRLRSLSPESPDFQTGMMELKELVTDHVAEEEEVLFAEAKLKIDTKALGSEMQERKQELLKSIS